MNKIMYLCVLPVSLLLMTGMSYMQDEGTGSNDVSTTHQKAQGQKQTVKPHADIDIDYVMPYPIELNETVSLPVSLRNGQAAEDVKVQISFDEGISSADGITEFSFGPHGRGGRSSFDIHFRVEREGRAYINVFASMLIEGQYQTRSFAIPVVVGDVDKNTVAPSMKGELEETPAGERLIILPATEH